MDNNIHSYNLAKNLNCGKKLFSMDWGFLNLFGDTLKVNFHVFSQGMLLLTDTIISLNKYHNIF